MQHFIVSKKLECEQWINENGFTIHAPGRQRCGSAGKKANRCTRLHSSLASLIHEKHKKIALLTCPVLVHQGLASGQVNNANKKTKMCIDCGAHITGPAPGDMYHFMPTVYP